MKKILLLILFYSTACTAKVPAISEVRLLYQKAASDEKACNELMELLTPYNENNNPLLLGYKAGITMMMARHVFNPFTKFSYFNKGKKMMRNAIEADEENIELRFLRFGVQTKAPSFLGHNEYILSDKAFLLQSLIRVTDTDLKQLIVSYLKDSGYLTPNEQQKLRS